jgi:glutamate/tyrosine decarboxylase-like PLP-dependent enzyme
MIYDSVYQYPVILGIEIDYHISCDKVVRLLGIEIDYHISCDKVVRLLGIDIDYNFIT